MAKKVFISYAWEDESFSQAILEFSNKLRANGIDANIDQYEENPDMGWPIWMEQQIETSDYVLVVATKTYLDKTCNLVNKILGLIKIVYLMNILGLIKTVWLLKPIKFIKII